MKEENKAKSVVKANRLIEAKYSISVEEKKFICYLISLISVDDIDLRLFKLRVKDIADCLKISPNGYYSTVKELTRNLVTNEIIIKDEQGSELQVAWLASADYKAGTGMVEVEISEKLKPYLINLKRNFTAYQLRNILQFKSIYSMRIYELLKQYETVGVRRINIFYLRDILKMDKSQYQKYSAFKRYVIEKAQKDLEKLSDISFTFDELKQGRKIVDLEFKIQPNQKRLILDSPSIGPQVSEEKIFKKLKAYGFTSKQIMETLMRYPTRQIEKNIEYTLKYNEKKPIKNFKGFLFSAITKDYHTIRLKKKS